MKHKTSHAKQKGFTLIELLVVIAIIAILAAILFPVFARAREQARKAACQSNLKQIGLAVAQYTQDFDESYPAAVNSSNAVGNRYWYEVLDPYMKSSQLLICPTAGVITSYSTGAKQYGGGYGWNIAGTGNLGANGNGFGYTTANWSTPGNDGPVQLSEVDEPSRTIQVGDPCSGGYTGNGIYIIGYSDMRYMPVLHGGSVGPFSAASTSVPSDTAGGGNYLFADGHVKFLRASQSLRSAMWNVDKDVTIGVTNPN
jgi:prepilin-type N-terminal cleavage/methylation domain-containing protein/prepilin-type processing-associated H-X9-DG protein